MGGGLLYLIVRWVYEFGQWMWYNRPASVAAGSDDEEEDEKRKKPKKRTTRKRRNSDASDSD
jgi:hypothetical protein